MLFIKPDVCWNLAGDVWFLESAFIQEVDNIMCVKKAWSSRIILEDECIKGLVTTRSDIGMWPRLSILNT